MIRQLPVVLSPTALQDLKSIGSYVFEKSGSEKIALAFIERIKSRCQRIGDAPRAGRLREDLTAGLRITPFERSAVISYVVEADLVRIINVFYGGRDFEAFLRDGEADLEN